MIIYNENLEFRQLRERPITDAIVLHHIGGHAAGVRAVHDYHLSKGWAGCAYHFYIDCDGGVYYGRPVWAAGGHCKGHNNHTVGIALDGNFELETPTVKQYEAAAQLCAQLCNDYGLSSNDLYRHRDLSPTVCPGRLFDLRRVKERVDELMSDNVPAWAAEAAAWAIKEGIITGDGNHIGWNEPLTKLQLIVVLHRALDKYHLL